MKKKQAATRNYAWEDFQLNSKFVPDKYCQVCGFPYSLRVETGNGFIVVHGDNEIHVEQKE